MISAFPEKASAEQDEQNDKRADVKSEQSAIEKNQKQDYNPKNVATCVALVGPVSTATAKTKTAESAE